MAGPTWILTLLCICVAGAHLSSPSSVLRSALEVQSGQNVSLTCNLTVSTDVAWYFLRVDQLLPLLTVSLNKVGDEMVDLHIADKRRIVSVGALRNGSVGLEILRVGETDAGLYLCSARCAGSVCFDRGIHLIVDAVEVESTRHPCWTLGICITPALLVLCVVMIAGFYLCSGKPAVCCCNSVRSDTSVKVFEEETLHYSSLNLADRPRPPGRGGTGLLREEVTYSTVLSHKNPNGSHDHK